MLRDIILIFKILYTDDEQTKEKLIITLYSEEKILGMVKFGILN